ncbi:MAG: phosphate ABC transporter substrate-binding protein [Defluviitaleaceae bacterium]|nr:phosphate ABC transporter substrate-binding protein [Defluviitaleaceae bacterium]
MKRNLLRAICTAVVASVMVLATACSGGGDGGNGGGGGNAPEQAVVVGGSTSVLPYMEDLAVSYPGTTPEVQGGGTSAGVSGVRAGTMSIGMASRALTDEEKSEFWNATIARDGIAIIVNTSNPVTELSVELIRDIFAGNITNWSDLGGNDATINVVTREEGSGTRSAFEELVMGSETIMTGAINQTSNGVIRTTVEGDANGIGFISIGNLAQGGVTGVSIGGVEPNNNNINNGTYQLYRPFILFTKEAPTGAVKSFMDYVLSNDGQTLLEGRGLVRVN